MRFRRKPKVIYSVGPIGATGPRGIQGPRGVPGPPAMDKDELAEFVTGVLREKGLL